MTTPSLLYKRLVKDEAAIHPSVIFGNNVRLGEGVVIEADCEIGDNVIIGHYSVLRPRTKIRHDSVIGHLSVSEGDCEIGERTTIQSQCHITKGAIIEDDVFIAPFFCAANTSQIVHGRDIVLKITPPIIRRAVRIGVGVFMLPGVEIGENAQIGLGSVVLKDIPAKQLWYGNPAKYVRDVPPAEWL